MPNFKTILVAPLHWGLGHATRCIPLINALIEANYKVLLASDGAALLLLRKEFPNVSYLELPSYDISYPKNGEYFKWKMLWKLPHIRKAIASEKKIIKKLVTNGSIDGIISDNRLGVSSENVPSAFITHQLNVLSGNTSYFSSKIHQRFIKKFNECWVPDVKGAANLSGKLGHIENAHFPIKYMGIISRFQKKELPLKYDILALLSGPEPQRSLFEEIIIEQLKGQDKKVLLVRGVIIDTQEKTQFENITIVNFMQSEELGNSINESEVIVARSGYTTILDLAALKKKAFFIPTPGQYEQNYLANRLKSLGLAPSCKQESFRIDKLLQVPLYKGLIGFESTRDFKSLFSLFEGEREF